MDPLNHWQSPNANVRSPFRGAPTPSAGAASPHPLPYQSPNLYLPRHPQADPNHGLHPFSYEGVNANNSQIPQSPTPYGGHHALNNAAGGSDRWAHQLFGSPGSAEAASTAAAAPSVTPQFTLPPALPPRTLQPTTPTPEDPVDHTPKRRMLEGATSEHFQKRNYYCSNLKEKRGLEMEKSIQDVLWDELKPKSLHGKKRKIDTDLPAEAQKNHLRFLYPTDKRNLANVCNAHTDAHHKLRETLFPEESKLKYIQHAKQILRQEVMQPWKCLCAVDTCPVGGFNYSDNLRKNVEGLAG